MSIIDPKKPIVPLSSVAELLETKSRTLRMYEERGLLPKYEGVDKKLYSLDDIQSIAFVHYLASVKKINANGIRYILEIINQNMDHSQKETILASVEKKLEDTPSSDINEPETL